jgi:phosphoserine phosphatase RsbU/P
MVTQPEESIRHIDVSRPEMFERAVHATNQSVMMVDARHDEYPIVFVNEAFERMTGYSLDDAVGRSLQFLTGPRTDPTALNRLTEVVEGALDATVTLLSYRKDGSTFWNEVAVSPVYDDDRALTHLITVQSDVTAYVLAQRDLEAIFVSERDAHRETTTARSQLQSVVRQLPTGVLVAEAPSGALIHGNEQMEKILGRSFDELAAADDYSALFAHHVDGSPMQPDEWPLTRSIAGGEIVEGDEIDVCRKDGSSVTIAMRSSPIRDEAGRIVAAVALFDDISARKKAERALHEARQRSVQLAQTLQRSLLPAALPTVDGIEFGAAYNPVGEGIEVGGDFYDVFEHRDGEWIVVIGDVMGKGVEAATVTSLARHVLRTAALRSRRPLSMLHVLNQALMRERENSDQPFATVAVGLMQHTYDGARLSLCLGGHPQPVIVRATGDIEMVGRPGTLMGVADNVEIHEVDIDLAIGDVLVLYTDGVTEARADDAFLGENGLQTLLSKPALRGLDASALAEAVQSHTLAYAHGNVRDDIAVLVTRIIGGADTAHL